MKRIITATLPALVMLMSCSKENIVGRGNVQTDQRTVSNFKQIEMSGKTEVFITQGPNFKVEVKAYSNLLPYFETTVEGELLKTGYREGIHINNDNAQLYITLPSLNGLFIYGSSEVTTTGNFSGAANFDIRMTGKSTVNLQEASADNLSIDVSGNGKVKAFGFTANNAVINLTGKGNIELTTVARLDVKITGNGNVYYKGNPVITSHIVGSGKIEKK